MSKQRKKVMRFLGTGAGDFYGSPDAAENDDRSGKDIRRAACVLLEPDVLVDFNCYEQLSKQNVPEGAIRHLVTTHSHYDHFQPTRVPELARRSSDGLNVYGSSTITDALDFAGQYRWDDAAGNFQVRKDYPDNSSLKAHTIRPGDSFTVGEFTVTAVLANHYIDKSTCTLQEQALNYVFQWGDRTLLYALDTSCVLPGSFEILSRFCFDGAVFDATFCNLEIDAAGSGHHNFAMLDKTLAQFRAARLFKPQATIVASHIYSGERHEQIEGQLAKMGVVLAYDGMTVEL